MFFFHTFAEGRFTAGKAPLCLASFSQAADRRPSAVDKSRKILSIVQPREDSLSGSVCALNAVVFHSGVVCALSWVTWVRFQSNRGRIKNKNGPRQTELVIERDRFKGTVSPCFLPASCSSQWNIHAVFRAAKVPPVNVCLP